MPFFSGFFFGFRIGLVDFRSLMIVKMIVLVLYFLLASSLSLSLSQC